MTGAGPWPDGGPVVASAVPGSTAQMTVVDFLQLASQALFLLLFLIVLARAVRQPRQESFHAALFFGAPAAVILLGWLEVPLGLSADRRAVDVISSSLILAIPYLLLRLVEDFSDVPPWLLHLGEAGLAAAISSIVAFAPPRPVWLAGLLALYFLGFILYGAVAFVIEAQHAVGVSRRRLQAVAIGSTLCGVAILFASIEATLPRVDGAWPVIISLLVLSSGLAYFIGFAPPAPLRRLWQDPELHSFLAGVSHLSEVADLGAVVENIERGTAETLGAPLALVALWDDRDHLLHAQADGQAFTLASGQGILGKVFQTRRAAFATDLEREHTPLAEPYRRAGVKAALVAPVAIGDDRLGVLAAFAKQPSFFVEDDLALIQVLAEQAAIVLRNHSLIEQMARLRAQEQAMVLKEDFISAAAHELKTPLTVLLGQAQLLERRAERDPRAPVDLNGVRRIIDESRHLDSLVRELLEAARVEADRLIGVPEPVDLAALARDACQEHASERSGCTVVASGPVIGEYDRARIRQLLALLLSNAIAFSPTGGEITIRVWRDAVNAQLTITDHGIGIPPEDIPHLFQRFYRGRNVDARRWPGLGLGLYVARQIVEQHGGRIWATSPGPGLGSTFHVVIPLAPAQSVRSSKPLTDR